MTFSSAVMDGSSWNDWNTKPTMRPRSSARPSSSSAESSCPSMRTVPELGVSRPASKPSNVDLPDPETPTMATDSPARTSKLTPDRMVNRASPVLTSLPSSWALMMVCEGLFKVVLRFALACALAVPAALAHAATILVYGDSLSAAYGLSREQGWVHLLEQRLRAEKLDYKVANASISGETTLGGRNRIRAALEQHRPAIVIVELGANDGLRGGNLDVIGKNLEAIIDASRAAKARVLLVGIRLPPNYGMAYIEKFQQVYRDVARRKKVPLVPYLFEGFGEKREYFQPDGIHPNGQAQPLLLDTVWKALQPLLSTGETENRK